MPGGVQPPLNSWIPQGLVLSLGKVILSLPARGTPKAGAPRRGRAVPMAPPQHPPKPMRVEKWDGAR